MPSLGRILRRLRTRFSPDGTEILRLHDTLEGQLSLVESQWLYRAAAGMKTIVEIGSFRGKSTILLARGGRGAAHIWAIDPHLDFPDHEKRMRYGAEDRAVMDAAIAREGCGTLITPIKKMSTDALPDWPKDKPIDLLWVDGDHRYEGVKADLVNWAPLVRVGGIVAAHDFTHWPDVARAWREEMTSKRWGPTHHVKSIAWTTRVNH